jgi:hypothetical protein
MFQTAQAAFKDGMSVDVSIVMPCLNEAQSLPHCIGNAMEALDRIAERYGLTGEIVIADNGSTDGSQAMAEKLGARVAGIDVRGYGAALIGGCQAAYGRFILMGDCDGSYDFTDGVAMIGELLDGHALCMGSRFDGKIAPGAMPWKNRYIGNPVLTGILNLFFRTGINDAHCGIRAISKEAFLRLNLSGTGMEFASEMVIKAALLRLPIAQVPATLSPDLRQRAPHLRPWRDGWRHLRYLMMLSPTWAFGVPALFALGISSCVLLVAFLHMVGLLPGSGPFGTSWTIAAGFLFTIGHFAAMMAVATHLHGVRHGYRRLRPLLRRWSHVFTLETMLIGGTAMVVIGLIGMVAITLYWSNGSFAALPNTLPLILAAVVGTTGAQTMFGGFLLSIIAGHDARLLPAEHIVPAFAEAS